MAIDLVKCGRVKLHKIRKLKAKNVYHRLLVKLYKFLSRRTTSKFNKCVLKRLLNSRVNRAPVSLSKLAKYSARKSVVDQKAKGDDIIFAVVGTVTNDTRIIDVPEMKVCALKFTEKARERIVAAKGKCITFDLDQKERMLFYLEVQEIEKQKSISVKLQVYLIQILSLM